MGDEGEALLWPYESGAVGDVDAPEVEEGREANAPAEDTVTDLIHNKYSLIPNHMTGKNPRNSGVNLIKSLIQPEEQFITSFSHEFIKY